jgi:hypothetical protein
MPVGIATSPGEGLGVSSANRLFEEQASAITKMVRRTIILRVCPDLAGSESLSELSQERDFFVDDSRHFVFS